MLNTATTGVAVAAFLGVVLFTHRHSRDQTLQRAGPLHEALERVEKRSGTGDEGMSVLRAPRIENELPDSRGIADYLVGCEESPAPRDETATIGGSVRLNGRPVSGARVIYAGAGSSVTDAMGRYELQGVEVGTAKLSLAFPASQTRGIDATLGGTTAMLEVPGGQVIEHDFDVIAPLGSIEGRVQYDDGGAASGVLVWAACDYYSTVAITAGTGRYSFRLPDMGLSYMVGVDRSVAVLRKDAVELGTSDLVFNLRRSGRFLITVEDPRGNGVEGAVLLWTPAGEEAWTSAGIAERGLAGVYELRVPTGQLDVVVHAPSAGLGSKQLNLLVPPSTTDADELTIILDDVTDAVFVAAQIPPRDARWFVVEEARSSEIAFAKGGGLMHSGYFPPEVIAYRSLQWDDLGQALVRGLCPGFYSLRCSASRIRPAPEVVYVAGDGAAVSVTWKELDETGNE